MIKYYDMQGNELTLEEWASRFEGRDSNRVAYNEMWVRNYPWSSTYQVYVSTVLLGMDVSLGRDGLPLIFETMIFGGKYNEYQKRYSTLEQAVQGHQLACRKAFGRFYNG